MRKRFVPLFFVLFLSLFPGLLLADCLDLADYTRWDLQDPHTIIFYRQNTPLAILKVPDCTIQTYSRVRLLQSFVCGGDKIEIDGQTCSILTVKIID
jgi:hypothetical protein